MSRSSGLPGVGPREPAVSINRYGAAVPKSPRRSWRGPRERVEVDDGAARRCASSARAVGSVADRHRGPEPAPSRRPRWPPARRRRRAPGVPRGRRRCPRPPGDRGRCDGTAVLPNRVLRCTRREVWTASRSTARARVHRLPCPARFGGRRTWPAMSLSPSTNDSRPAATRRRWRTASVPESRVAASCTTSWYPGRVPGHGRNQRCGVRLAPPARVHLGPLTRGHHADLFGAGRSRRSGNASTSASGVKESDSRRFSGTRQPGTETHASALT